MLDPPKGSVIWDFMLSSKDIVHKYISWELNCGDKINFWRDSWNGQPPLITLPNIQEIGEYDVELKLHPNVTARVRVIVYAN